jgi:MSHA biogenesis protein MshM
MYYDHFGLRVPPFSILPDPVFAVPTDSHMRALARVLDVGASAPDWIKVTGVAGTGKTLLCHRLGELLATNAGRATEVLYLPHPAATAVHLLRSLARRLDPGSDEAVRDLGVDELVDRVGGLLADRTRRGVTVVACLDECQAMAPAALDALRRIAEPIAGSNGMQLVLFGNPEFDTLLALPEMAPLRSRIGTALQLGPMTAAETARYLSHRLTLAGARGPSLFSPALADLVHRAARGLPRSVNLVAHAALTLAWREGATTINAAQIRAAAAGTPNASRLGSIVRAANWLESLIAS